MKRKYELQNKKEKYIVYAEIDKLYNIMETITIWEEEFLILDRVCLNS